MKELKEKLIRGKTLPPLNKVEDINVIAGVLKDFLRNLPEPLLTFHLNKAFMEAAGEFVRLQDLQEFLCVWMFDAFILRELNLHWVVEFPAWDRGKSIHEYKTSYVLIIY